MRNLILILVAFFSISTLAKASCDYGCNTPWVEETYVIDYNGCSFFVTFEYRECTPPTRREVRIKKLSIDAGCHYSNNRLELMEVAVKYILNNSYGLFPSMNSSSNDIHVYTDCCWIKNGLDELDWVPCETDCCCETVVNVDENTWPDGKKYYTLGGKLVLSDDYGYDCGLSGTGGTSACKNMCGYMDRIDIGEDLLVSTYQCQDTCTSVWTSGDITNPVANPCDPTFLMYSSRECGGKTQIRFGSFKYNSNSNPPCDLDSIMRRAIIMVLKEEAPNYSLPRTFEINLPTCYRLDTLNNEDYALVCFWEDNCCLVSYNVHGSSPSFYANNYVLDTLNGFVSCGTDTTCNFVCDSIYLYIDPTVALAKKFDYKIEDNIFETRTEVYPNPTKNLITFDINSKLSMDMELVIYTNEGKEIDRLKLQNDEGKLYYTYDTKKIPKGVYLFKVIAGINTVDVGKFVKE
jgi:hypothetical protein